MVREGVTDAMIRATFQILAQQVEAMRGADRAQALLGGELTRMIRGARDWQARGQTDREDQRRRESAAIDQSADSDFLTPPPRPTEAMFYGLTGEVARTAAGREVNPVSVAAAFLSWLSAQVGRDVYLQVGDVRHPVPLFTLHVGRTAIAAKGESTGLPLRIDEAIRQSPLARLGPEQHLLGQTHAGGLSSREGLTLFVHDGYKSGRDDIPSIEDKRLWVFEPEFQNVIAQGKREGNTLSAALRDVWDGGSIKPATKGGRIWITNGFGNRFLLIWAERTCLVPLPRATERADLRERRVYRYRLSDRPTDWLLPAATWRRTARLGAALWI
jgi:putative DNA primase/helicase